MTILENYTDDEFINIVKNSFTYREVLHKLGYSYYSGTSYGKIKERILNLNIDISHFKPTKPTKRNEENVFIKDSTASQKVLRTYYKKGNYTPYICSICHRIPIWEGKKLTLVLDHINGENTDDRLENLRWVCPNCNSQLETTCKQKPKSKKKYYCIDCGKEIEYRSTRCNSCEIKRRKNKYITELPITRDELKILVRNSSFTDIAKIYKVSNKTISYWCQTLNLPYKKSEIKKYSDEEWKKI